MQIRLRFSKKFHPFNKGWKLAIFIGIILLILVRHSSSYEVSLNLWFLNGHFSKETRIPASLKPIERPAEIQAER